jgi:Na+/H+-translocating membrane pyrophosphatase
MSADLFGSFAESTCAALVMSSTSLDWKWIWMLLQNFQFMYPLMLIAIGIFICISSVPCQLTAQSENITRVETTLKAPTSLSPLFYYWEVFLAAAWLTYPSNFELRVKIILSVD